MTYEPPQTEVDDTPIPEITEDAEFLRMLQELTDEEILDDTSDDTPDEETTDTPDEPETEPVDRVWTFDDGLSIDREKARNLALFDAWLGANPEQASRLAGVAQGELDVVPLTGRGVPDANITGTIPTTPANIAATNVPEDIDMDDPVQRRIWNELQETRQQIAAQNNLLQRHQQQIDQSSRNTTEALINRISEEFREKNELSVDDLKVIRRRAAELIPQFTNPIDIETGLPRQVDPVYAIEQSLDAAKWSIPEFRDRALETLAKSKLEDLRKKSKLTSLGGSSGSVPRKATTPSTEHERREAMIAEVAAEMSGGHSG
jgi:hypothetical protein